MPVLVLLHQIVAWRELAAEPLLRGAPLAERAQTGDPLGGGGRVVPCSVPWSAGGPFPSLCR